jgi:hypothetical protein
LPSAKAIYYFFKQTPKVTAAEIYAVIIDDLQFAVDNLPMRVRRIHKPGEFNKGAAQAYLG